MRPQQLAFDFTPQRAAGSTALPPLPERNLWTDPVAFVEQVLGIPLSPSQHHILGRIAETYTLEALRIAVRSGRSIPTSLTLRGDGVDLWSVLVPSPTAE